jgi:hypothetical protein
MIVKLERYALDESAQMSQDESALARRSLDQPIIAELRAIGYLGSFHLSRLIVTVWWLIKSLGRRHICRYICRLTVAEQLTFPLPGERY